MSIENTGEWRTCFRCGNPVYSDTIHHCPSSASPSMTNSVGGYSPNLTCNMGYCNCATHAKRIADLEHSVELWRLAGQNWERQRAELEAALANTKPHMENLYKIAAMLMDAGLMAGEEDFEHLAVERLLAALADARDEIKQHDLWREEAERQIAERTKEQDALQARIDDWTGRLEARLAAERTPLEAKCARLSNAMKAFQEWLKGNLGDEEAMACLANTQADFENSSAWLADALAAERKAGKVDGLKKAAKFIYDNFSVQGGNALATEAAKIESGESKPPAEPEVKL